MTRAETPDPEVARLAAECAALLDRAHELVEGLPAEDFAAAPEELACGSVGSQLRHCTDFLHCFLAGLDEGRVDYDRREREAAWERDPCLASERLGSLVQRLRAMGGASDRPLWVRMDEAPEAADAGWSRSSIGRELRFLISHTIHHFALIDVLVRWGGRRPGPGFGVAPSTLHYQRLSST